MDLAHVTGLDDDPALHAGLLADEVVVHRGEHQERWDRCEIGVGVAIAQHQELRSGLDRGVGLRAHLSEALGEGLLALLDLVQAPDDVCGLASAPGLEVLDLRELVVVDHREVEHDLPRVLGRGREEVALRPQAEAHRSHDLFADRVERRVGHLRELLREVVEEQPRAVAEHRDRRVGPHRTERLDAVLRHRPDEDADLLLGVAEGALPAHDRRRGVGDVLALRQVGQVDAAVVEPVLPRLGGGELCLDLVVLDDSALRRVDQEHLARAQAALAHDPVGREVEHADLAGEYHEAVVGDEEPSRTQPVPVERRADECAVGEDEGGRAVPRLHEHRVELVEGPARRVDVGLILPGLRNHHHDRVRKRPAAERQQFDHLVEGGRVARALAHDREERAEVAEQVGFQLALPGAHPVAVALHGVDLAVVRDHAERLGQRP